MSTTAETSPHAPLERLDIELPERPVSLPETPAQNGREAAFCLVEDVDSARQVRFKGDARIWEWSGVYEYLVRQLLQGNAPSTLSGLLQRTLHMTGNSPERLRCLLLGAGNGWVADEFVRVGVGQVVGVDVSSAAAAAADRDHPDAFSEYLVLDMRRLSEAQRDELMDFDFNCMVALDPIAAEEPAPNAFTEAFNLLAPDGWVVLHLAEETAVQNSESRFARLMHRMVSNGALKLETRERYRHRLTTHGEPLYHVALIGRKVRDFDPGEPI